MNDASVADGVRGFATRMSAYMREMYPVLPRFMSAALLYVSFNFLLGGILGTEQPLSIGITLLGVWNVFALGLILRLMDEFKDQEIDRQLFSDRSLPSGKVFPTDLGVSLIIVCLAYLAANAIALGTLTVSLIVLGYALLMFRYFFVPRLLRRYLFLNLATHNPIVPLMLVGLALPLLPGNTYAVQDYHLLQVFLLIVMYWALLFSWEIARKIRAPHEENDYVTYSQILGPAGAVCLAAGVQTLAFALGAFFWQTLSLSWGTLIVMACGYLTVIVAYARFLRDPRGRGLQLKVWTERYITVMFVAPILDFVLRQWD